MPPLIGIKYIPKETHHDPPLHRLWGDLRLLEPDRRYNLASQIEKLEDIELRKQQTLNAIAAGKKSVEDVALDRLLQKTKVRKGSPPLDKAEDKDEPND